MNWNRVGGITKVMEPTAVIDLAMALADRDVEAAVATKRMCGSTEVGACLPVAGVSDRFACERVSQIEFRALCPSSDAGRMIGQGGLMIDRRPEKAGEVTPLDKISGSICRGGDVNEALTSELARVGVTVDGLASGNVLTIVLKRWFRVVALDHFATTARIPSAPWKRPEEVACDLTVSSSGSVALGHQGDTCDPWISRRSRGSGRRLGHAAIPGVQMSVSANGEPDTQLRLVQ